MMTGRCRQQDWDDLTELTRDCGGGRRKRGLEMEIVAKKGITRKTPYFDCERTKPRSSWRYFGGPVRKCEERCR